jgi:hypothetical protein
MGGHQEAEMNSTEESKGTEREKNVTSKMK